jgi:hypothetical protein
MSEVRPIDPMTPTPDAGSLAGINQKIAYLDRRVDDLRKRVGQQATNSVTTAQIGPGQVQAGNILAGSIIAGHLDVGAVTADAIAANAINTDHVATHALDADDIFVSQLSALSANMGEILAGTITGGTFQTNSPGLNPRVALDPNGVYAYRADGTQTFWIDATTGKVMTIAGVGGFNIVPNSSFEDVVAPTGGWADSNSGGSAPTLAVSTTQKKHGANSLRVTSNSTSGDVGLILLAANAPAATAGKTYTASLWAYPTAARALKVQIEFLDASNASLGTQTTTLAAPTVNDWNRICVSMDAPASTAKVRLRGWFTTTTVGDIVYFDALQIEEGQIQTTYVPKADEILSQTVNGGHIAPLSITTGHVQALSIDAGKIASGAIDATKIAASSITAKHIQTIGVDMIQNPSFEWDLDGWALCNGSGALVRFANATSPDGDYTAQLPTGSVGWGHKALPVRPGETYYFSVRVKHSNGNGTYYVSMNEKADYPAGGYVTTALAGSQTHLANNLANTGITGWTLLEYTYTVPAGVFWVSPLIQNIGSTGTLEFDAVKMNSSHGGIITSGRFQTSTGASRVQMDSTGVFSTVDNAATKDIHLTTSGLVLRTGDTSLVPTERSVIWRDAGGFKTATLSAYASSADYRSYKLEAFANDGTALKAWTWGYGNNTTGLSGAQLAATSTYGASITTQAATVATDAYTVTSVAGTSKYILKGDGTSAYVMLQGTQTINGAKTFNNAVAITYGSGATNSLTTTGRITGAGDGIYAQNGWVQAAGAVYAGSYLYFGPSWNIYWYNNSGWMRTNGSMQVDGGFQLNYNSWFQSYEGAYRMYWGYASRTYFGGQNDGSNIAVQFRANNGDIGYINASNGSYVATSDRAVKTGFQIANNESYLERFKELPLLNHYYGADFSKEGHIGVTSQDFYQLYPELELTSNKRDAGAYNEFGKRIPRGIAYLDLLGVTMASVKALAERDEASTARISELEGEVADLRDAIREVAVSVGTLRKEANHG